LFYKVWSMYFSFVSCYVAFCSWSFVFFRFAWLLNFSLFTYCLEPTFTPL
jgi:hypothetical protein